MARKTNRYRATADIKYSKAFPSWVTEVQFVISFYPFRSFSRVFIGRSMRHLEARRNIRSRVSFLSLSCSLALSFSLSSVRIKHGGGSRVLSDISTIAAYIKGEGGILKTMISTRGRGANNGREEKWDFSWQDLNLNHV